MEPHPLCSGRQLKQCDSYIKESVYICDNMKTNEPEPKMMWGFAYEMFLATL